MNFSRSSIFIIAFVCLISYVSCNSNSVRFPRHPTKYYSENNGFYKQNNIQTYKSLADSLSYFGADLMKELYAASNQVENVVYSPINVYSALALLLLGAKGTTRDEISAAMRLPNNNQQNTWNRINDYKDIAELLKQLQDKNIRFGNKTVSQVSLASGIFVDNHLRIKKAYDDQIQNYYNGHIKRLDFSNGYAAINYINQWISSKTQGQISKIFTEPLNQLSSIIAVASVYFSGGWVERFPAHLTKIEPFDSAGRIINVKMMNNKGRIPYYKNLHQKYESIQLDFHGRFYSAVFILPFEGQTISNLINSLNAHELNENLNQTANRGVNYKIPKMKFHSFKSLKEPLRSKGLSKLFQKADFSAMLESNEYKISDITHGVEIEVDESGAKATAVTSVRIEPLAAKNPPENTVDFYLNRSFIMFIQHKSSGTVLFAAVVHEPVQ